MSELISLKVSKDTHPRNLSTAIVKFLETNDEIEVVSVGPESVNQAVKGIASASGLISMKHKTISVEIFFRDIQMQYSNDIKTAIVFRLRKKDVPLAKESV